MKENNIDTQKDIEKNDQKNGQHFHSKKNNVVLEQTHQYARENGKEYILVLVKE